MASILMLVATASAGDAPPELSRIVSLIGGQAEWLADLLYRASCDVADRDAALRECDVSAVVRAAVEAMRPVYAGALRYVCTEPLPAKADPVGLRRAVANLVDNAIRAAGPAGTVRVRVRDHGDRAEIEVEDDGPGFGQIARGTGLGLDIARHAVAEWGGSLIAGAGPRGGVLVRLTLPLSPSADLYAERGAS